MYTLFGTTYEKRCTGIFLMILGSQTETILCIMMYGDGEFQFIQVARENP